MDEELDIIEMQDDDGNEITMQIIDYFFYEGQEYAILVPETEDDEEETDEEIALSEVYIATVTPVGDDEEEIALVEDEALLEKLVDFVQNELFADEDEEFGAAADPETDD